MAKSLKKRHHYCLVGIDEVGRGPLAGPVTAAAVILNRKKYFSGLKDSKKLTASQRNWWFKTLKNCPGISYAISSVYPKTIDKINVAEAANRAATRAFRKLISKVFWKTPLKVYLDGGLFLKCPANIQKKCIIKTIVKGDEKINVIKIASIMAKVRRDHYMKQLHKKYPSFGFDNHKGYGTRAHFAAIGRYGLSPHHRLTFLRKYLKIKKNSKNHDSNFN